MVTNQNKQTEKKFDKASLLDRFKLDFEYDVSWQDAKRDVKARTLR